MYTIGKAARESGVSIGTIRYYEREGILPKAERMANGRRIFDNNAISRIRFVRRSRDLDFSIKEIKELLNLAENGTMSCANASKIGSSHRRRINQKIKDLQDLDIALEKLLKDCSEDRPDCPMLSSLLASEHSSLRSNT